MEIIFNSIHEIKVMGNEAIFYELYETPDGYNPNDYKKCVAFLSQTDEKGVSNGDKLSEDYDPSNPETWGADYYGNPYFEWINLDGELRIQEMDVDRHRLWGTLAGTLDVSGCTALSWLTCSNNNLTSLNVSDCTALEELYCDDNNLTELDVSGCTALKELDCRNNNLTSVIVPAHTHVLCDDSVEVTRK